jgi:RNA polymerase sigma-70 factor (ECF subfamily)
MGTPDDAHPADDPRDPRDAAGQQDVLLRKVLDERVPILAVIRSIVRRRDVAEDVFQDLCVLAIQKRPDIVDERHLAGWLRTAARQLALNVARKHANRSLLLGDKVHELMEPHWRRQEARAGGSALGDALEVCLGRLSETARRIIQGRYVDGLDCIELARRLKRPVGSLYVTLSRIHKQLAECVLRRMAAEAGRA